MSLHNEAAAALSLGALAAAATAVEAATRAPPPPPPPPPQPVSHQPPQPRVARTIAPMPVPLQSTAAHTLAPRGAPLKPKQKRYRANPDQLRDLVNLFNCNPSPTAAELTALSVRIAMPTQSVILWFKNRRARVPHKKAEKERRAAAAKVDRERARRNVSASSGTTSATTTTTIPTAVAQSNYPDGTAAALVMAEMAMSNRSSAPPSTSTASSLPLAPQPLPLPSQVGHPQQIRSPTTLHPLPERVVSPNQPRIVPMSSALATLCSVAQDAARRNQHAPIPQPPPLPPTVRAITCSPIGPLPKVELTIPSSNYYPVARTTTSEFGVSTPRRPRVLPQTPRIRAQLQYTEGDAIEVMEMIDGHTKTWIPATVMGRASDPNELHLGESVATAMVNKARVEDDAGSESGTSERKVESDLSPRTVQSPAASPTPAVAKAKYMIRYEGKDKKIEEVIASRMRPAPPATEWTPQTGDAVEANVDGKWMVGLVKSYAPRKGWLVQVEGEECISWMRREALRAYQVWRGGEEWVCKTKAPRTLGRRGTTLPVAPLPMMNMSEPNTGRKRSATVTEEVDTEQGRRRSTRKRTRTLVV